MGSAIAQQKGNSTDFIDPKYWPLLKIWADYLVSTTFDPADQLCTDDFMGKSASNANLAIKGIIALGAYAQLMEFKGDTANAEKYMAIARNYTAYWMEHARAADGSHYKLAYNLSDATWSQKYNLVWDKIAALEAARERDNRHKKLAGRGDGQGSPFKFDASRRHSIQAQQQQVA